MAVDLMLEPPRTTSRAGRASWHWGQWLIIPMLVLGGCELFLRLHPKDALRWYEAAAVEATHHHVDYIFVGSSRVGAAIDVATFTKVMSQRLGRPVYALNLGRGYSTGVEHYLGLRQLFERTPQNLKGCVVFYEAAGKVLDLGSWRDRWVHPEQPELIVPMLGFRDLPALWRSKEKLDTKVGVTIRFLGRPMALLSRRERLRERLLWAGESLVARVLDRIHPAPRLMTAADLSSNGGIRRDEAGVIRARALAEGFAQEQIRLQRSHQEWDSPVFDATRKLVEQRYGSIVLFDLPLSSVFSRIYQTDTARRSQQSFQQYLSRTNVMLLAPSFPTDDNDFPDLWHLRQSKSTDFTAALANAYCSVLATTGKEAGRIAPGLGGELRQSSLANSP